MSVEKFFALYFPLKTKTVCTVKTAKRVTTVAAVIIFGFDAQFFFIVKANKSNLCEFIRVSESCTMTLNRIDAVLYSFAPFAIIGLFNLAIIYKFVKAKLESEHAGTTESTNQALSKSAMRGTAILITVSFTFLLFTSPATIVFSITNYPNPIVTVITYVLMCMNHSINAILYCNVGSRFRQEVLRMLGCGKENNQRKGVPVIKAESSVYTSDSATFTTTLSI